MQLLLTIIAFFAAIVASGLVQAYLPQTLLGGVLGMAVFIYAFAPVAQRTFLKNDPNKYWQMAIAVFAIGAALLTVLPKLPYYRQVGGAFVAFMLAGWIVSLFVDLKHRLHP